METSPVPAAVPIVGQTHGRFRLVAARRTPAQWTDLYLRAAEGAAAAGDLRVLRSFLHDRDLGCRVREHMPSAEGRVLHLHEEDGRLTAFEAANGPGSALDPHATHIDLARWMKANIASLKADMEPARG